MRFTFATALVALVGSTLAAPAAIASSRYAALADVEARAESTHTLLRRNCSPMPSSVDPKMRDIIYKTVKQQTDDEKILLITMVTAYTESMVNNLDCGDKDSLGLYQQRPSQGWGNPEQLQDPVYSTKKFLSALNGVYDRNRGKNAGVIAQIVQVAEAGNQYTKNLAMAQRLVEQARASVGGSVGPSKGDDNDNNEDDGKDNEDKPAKPTKGNGGSGGNGGAINVGGAPTKTETGESSTETGTTDGPSDDDADCDDSLPACESYYVPKPGDNCHRVAKQFGIKLESFYKLNPEIDATCQNLYVGKQYCVAAADA